MCFSSVTFFPSNHNLLNSSCHFAFGLMSNITSYELMNVESSLFFLFILDSEPDNLLKFYSVNKIDSHSSLFFVCKIISDGGA